MMLKSMFLLVMLLHIAHDAAEHVLLVMLLHIAHDAEEHVPVSHVTAYCS